MSNNRYVCWYYLDRSSDFRIVEIVDQHEVGPVEVAGLDTYGFKRGST
jgi:hypothetical protein